MSDLIGATYDRARSHLVRLLQDNGATITELSTTRALCFFCSTPFTGLVRAIEEQHAPGAPNTPRHYYPIDKHCLQRYSTLHQS